MQLTLYTSDFTGKESNTIYPHKIKVKDSASFLSAITKDHVCACYKNNHRSNKNFIESDTVMLDVDNDLSDNPKDWIDPDSMASFLPGVSLVITPSRHNLIVKGTLSARPRFHVYLPITVIKNADTYAALKQKILTTFPFFDKGAMDAARFVYGNNAKDIIWQNGSVTIDQYLSIPADTSTICEGNRNNHMSQFAGKVVKRYGFTDKARQIFDLEAQKCDPPLDRDELDKVWQSASKFGDKVSNEAGYIPPTIYNDVFGTVPSPLKPDDYSDIGEGMCLARNCHNQLKYSDGTDYIRFVKDHWIETKAQQFAAAEEFLKIQLSDALSDLKKAKEALETVGLSEIQVQAAKKSPANFQDNQLHAALNYYSAQQYLAFVMKRRDMKYVKAALEAAKPLLEINTEDLDADPFLLNTPAGTYDLRKGLSGIKPHDPLDLITKITRVSPGNDGEDLWLGSLDKTFEGDQELIDYVHKVVGLSAIGKVFVEALVISYGTGSNGKSTFWNSINAVLGSYGGQLSADTLTVHSRSNTKPEMAELKGKRLVIAAELKEGVRLDTSMIKQLCSTDQVYAEKKYKSPFGFKPTHTLVLYTNHLPRIGANDPGTWRRLIVIPFDATITGSSDIKNYSDYLVHNAGPAILKWIIEGAKQVINEDYDLTLPTCVQDAIDAYRESNDWLTHFIEDCCEVDKTYSEKSGPLYQQYRQYAQANGEFIRSTQDFYSSLEIAGFDHYRSNKGKYVKGLRLNTDFTGI